MDKVPPEAKEGMIDLGYESPVAMMSEDGKSDKGAKSYPSFHVNDVEELDDLPDGEFYFIAKGKVTRHSESTPHEGEEHCDCDISVMEMKPLGGAAEGTAEEEASESPEEESEEQAEGEGDAGDKLDATLNKMQKAKSEDNEE